MISIIITHQDSWITHVKVEGHALFKPLGKDIVCAGISTASIQLFNTLERLNFTHEAGFHEGLLEFDIASPSEISERVMEAYLKSVTDIEASYPEHVRVSHT
jgi:uncharacterized protein